MKRSKLLILIGIAFLGKTRAQFVTISDPAFANRLQQLFTSCMNGNQLDTSCTQVINASVLNVSGSNISNLEGIQYFDNLIR